MQYIKKQIELDTSGHINEYWECDFKNVKLIDLPNISVNMLGTKSYTDKMNGKKTSDMKNVIVTSSDLELTGSIGYGNIPKLYEVLTEKLVSETYWGDEVTTEAGFANGIPYEAGETIKVEKTRQVPAFPTFYGGEIITIE